jgi:uncharacterized membrane protein
MELISKIALIFHIAAGFAALITGAISILTQKGGKIHRTTGKIYYWAMSLVALTALVISVYKGITFLFLIAIFSYYMTFTGYRTLQFKKISGDKIGKIDWIMLIFSALTGIGMIIISLMKWIILPEVVGVFGVVMCSFSFRDYKYFVEQAQEKKKWLFRHIGRMCGAYISTFTAFLVVNVNTDPAYIAWLAPTFVGTPLIAYYIRSYKIKLSKQVS